MSTRNPKEANREMKDEDEREAAKESVKVVDRRSWAQDPLSTGSPTGPDAETRRYPTFVEELRERTEKAERRVNELVAAHRQVQAEQEQFRLRLTRDVERRVDAEIGATLARLLDVLDDLNRAVRHAEEVASGGDSPAFQALLDGVRHVRDRFLSVMRERGVEPIETVGRPFDPNVAEAIQIVEVEDDSREGVVLDEIQTGFSFKGQILRPARVLVGQSRKDAPSA